VLWAVATLGFAWLWDQWMLSGPHGPYRWEGTDFAPYWVGVRAMLHRVSPYHPEVTRQIQEIVYGGPATGKDPMLFVYPAWVFLLILPLGLLPFKWATILYSSALFASLLLFLVALANNLGATTRAKKLWFGVLSVGALPFMVFSVVKGQLGYVGLLALYIAYRLFNTMPVAAGIALSIALLKPSTTFISVSVFVLVSVVHKNWKFLWSFLGSMLVLLITSFMAIGNWSWDYLHILATQGDVPVLWSLTILPLPWNILYGGFFVGMGIWRLWRVLGEAKGEWFPVAVLLNIALIPAHWIYDLFFGYLIVSDRRVQRWREVFIIGAAILASWLVILAPLNARGATAIVAIPLVWALVVWEDYRS